MNAGEVRPAPAFGEGVQGRFLMLVKTYPLPSQSYEETVCCAGIDVATRRWIRMYPVNFRSLAEYARFRKWQFIDAAWGPPRNDPRPESRRVWQETIEAGAVIPAARWAERRTWLDPLLDQSLEVLHDLQRSERRSLGVIKPRRIRRLVIRKAEGWDEVARRNMAQLSFDLTGSRSLRGDLEIIPYDFVYEFDCEDARCKGHAMEIFDWEAGQAYRRFRREYGAAGWEAKFREKWEDELPARDLHLVLGTHHRHGTWMIVGVLYPPHPKVSEGKGRSRGQLVGQEGAMTLPWLELET
jgi:hypothetical protein